MERPARPVVQALLNVTFTDAEIDAALDDAEVMFGECGLGYSIAKQRVLMKYLAAHLLSVTEKGQRGAVTSESVDGTSISYTRGPLGAGLRSTPFGQQLLVLDTNGCIQDLERRPVSFDLL